jgi:predicted amidophosphoribosyltransferase
VRRRRDLAEAPVARPGVSQAVPSVEHMLLTCRCPGCDRPDRALCARCRQDIDSPAGPLPVPGLVVVAWARYDGAARAVVLALKHGGRRDLARYLARQLAPLAPPVDVVTWVPASASGRRRRGYDQGALVARGVARHLDRPAVALLGRPRRSASRRGQNRLERLGGPDLVVRRPATGARVLVVDDVCTTGASLERAARALRRAGAVSVHGLVVAIADRDLGPCRDPVGGSYGRSRPLEKEGPTCR